jgi:hypothetical protein
MHSFKYVLPFNVLWEIKDSDAVSDKKFFLSYLQWFTIEYYLGLCMVIIFVSHLHYYYYYYCFSFNKHFYKDSLLVRNFNIL